MESKSPNEQDSLCGRIGDWFKKHKRQLLIYGGTAYVSFCGISAGMIGTYKNIYSEHFLFEGDLVTQGMTAQEKGSEMIWYGNVTDRLKECIAGEDRILSDNEIRKFLDSVGYRERLEPCTDFSLRRYVMEGYNSGFDTHFVRLTKPVVSGKHVYVPLESAMETLRDCKRDTYGP